MRLCGVAYVYGPESAPAVRTCHMAKSSVSEKHLQVCLCAEGSVEEHVYTEAYREKKKLENISRKKAKKEKENTNWRKMLAWSEFIDFDDCRVASKLMVSCNHTFLTIFEHFSQFNFACTSKSSRLQVFAHRLYSFNHGNADMHMRLLFIVYAVSSLDIRRQRRHTVCKDKRKQN